MSDIVSRLSNLVQNMDSLSPIDLLQVISSLESLLAKTKELLTTSTTGTLAPSPVERALDITTGGAHEPEKTNPVVLPTQETPSDLREESPTTTEACPQNTAEVDVAGVNNCKQHLQFLPGTLYDRTLNELKSLKVLKSSHPNSPGLYQFSDKFHYAWNGHSKSSPCHPVTPVMKELLLHANSVLGCDFNHILVSKYHSYRACLGAHQDDEDQLDPRSPVATISFNRVRHMRITKPSGEIVANVSLPVNSCFTMLYGFQDSYRHAIPAGCQKSKEEKGTRFSITLRKVVSPPPLNLNPAAPALPAPPAPALVELATQQGPFEAVKVDTLVFGSSLTKDLNPDLLSKHQKQFKVYPFRGAHSTRILDNLKKKVETKEIVCSEISSIFFVCGGNDVENVPDLSVVKANYRALLDYTVSAFPNAKINAVSLIPRRTRKEFPDHRSRMCNMNTWMEKFCKEHQVRFINIWTFYVDKKSDDLRYNLFSKDEVHFSQTGTSVLAKVLIAVANSPRSTEG